ncbi:MAG: lycopene cyclase domain-containing protein [Armatimonadetes bacterium]|nr:lycopene cyclase domain-containing protein [Armatimonadota bacterium]
MTYAQFLLVFLVLPIAFLSVLLRHRWRRRHGLACAAVCLLALLYTSPWDNHAAATRLWTFDPHFAPPSHFILHLPWEEYAFYGLQGLLTCLLVIALSRRSEDQ